MCIRDRWTPRSGLLSWPCHEASATAAGDGPTASGERIRRTPAFPARFGLVGLGQVDQRLPGQHHLHLREDLLPLGLLLVALPPSTLGRGKGAGERVIREAKLLTAHHPSPGLRSQDYCPANGLGFPESP
jgi:hypothetical protein